MKMKVIDRVDNNCRFINGLIIFIILFTTSTGWHLLDDILGMNMFWAVFITGSLLISVLVIRRFRKRISLESLIRDRLNILLLVYMVWMSLTYLVNYQGRSTLLYIFKMGFILAVYTVVVGIYIKNIGEGAKKKLILNISRAIFILGVFHSFIAIYQITSLSNTILSIRVTEWPAYNPASLYGNVNGFGTYLFFSIMSGIYMLSSAMKAKSRTAVLFFLIVQGYVLYFTVARTSILVTLLFLMVSTPLFLIKNRKAFTPLLNFRMLGTVILSIILMTAVMNFTSYEHMLGIRREPQHTRDAADMLKEKNSKGFNHRQFIWQSVIRDYEEYIMFGDGLKYNIVRKINVEEVISKRSAGAERISYHNTLFRYFASNGLIGLALFLILFWHVPFKQAVRMAGNRKINLSGALIILLFACIFLYGQMEEVYIGEIGLVQLLTVIAMAYGNSRVDYVGARVNLEADAA
jgi:O-antigen ligase